MKEQILKAIKGLKSFTIEDIELITGFDEAEIQKIIKELPVKNTGNIYTFDESGIKILKPPVKKKKSGIDNLKLPEIKRIKILEFTEEELRVYYSAPERVRKRGVN